MSWSPGHPAAPRTGRAHARLRECARWYLVAAAVALLSAGGCLREADAGTGAVTVAPTVATADRALASGRTRTGARDQRPARLLDVEQVRAEMRKARGHVLFVHIWATWCLPCLDELPLIERFAGQARGRGAAVFSVSLDTDASGIARVPAVLRDRAPTLTANVAHFDDPERFISLFSQSWEGVIPALFAFDRGGKLQGSLIGEVEPAELDALLAKLAPPPLPGRSIKRR